MKIVFAPQVYINELCPTNSTADMPLGLLSLIGSLDRDRYTAEILDPTVAVNERFLRYDKHFARATASLMLSTGCDVVGLSTSSYFYHHTLGIAREVKALSPSTFVVLGGPQASFCDQETIEAFPVDCVVRGEGEITVPELFEALHGGHGLDDILGITFRRGGTIVRNPDRPFIEDLDTLPMPAYDAYPRVHGSGVHVEFSRGCPHRCTYCATSMFWQRKVRRKSIDRVIEEMMIVGKTYHHQPIIFTDDMFNKKMVVEFCERLIAVDFKGRWRIATRIDNMDDETLGLLSRAGCDRILYGVESGSSRIQGLIHKNIKVDQVIDVLKKTAAHGIGVKTSFIMGFPEETEEDLAETFSLSNQIRLLFPTKQAVEVNVLVPENSTEIFARHGDKIRYDGHSSNRTHIVGSGLDEEMIRAHPALFSAYHYVETEFMERGFVKLVSQFCLMAQVVCYWSSLYIMQVDGDPLALPKVWIEYFKENFFERYVARKEHLASLVFSSFEPFFKAYFSQHAKIPRSVQELFEHEYETIRTNESYAIDPNTQRGASEHCEPSTRQFEYDPSETIALIQQDFRMVVNQQKCAVSIDYRPIWHESEGLDGA